MTFENWQLGLIGLISGLILVLIMLTLYFCFRRHQLSIARKAAMREMINIDEILALESVLGKEPDHTTQLPQLSDEQPVDEVQTALSPSQQQRQRKQLPPLEQEEPKREPRREFSLSPVPDHENNIQSTTPLSNISRSSIHSHRMSATVQAGIAQTWRGPTPPWTMNKS
ncbi:hypothetical protein CU097_014956 [Rhizopus azygosporus]|uniref:Uncharacterized protein n=1 Tax=Rhizopus azygosporus TaxID=86630 RepID=A0A367KC04_RHIAZ|nr:hypothetical protein CU097_014956 [Rhizopus azygosporus]